MGQQDYKQAVDSIVVDEHLRSKIHDDVFKSVNSKKNFNKFVLKHRKIAAAAVILLLLCIPGSVIGARGIWQQHMDVSVENVGQYAMNYTFQTVTDSKGDSDITSLIHVPVKLEYGYVPDGYVSESGIKFSLNGKGVQGLSVIVYSVDSDNPLYFQGVAKITDTEINGHKAVIQERTTAWNSLLIFYDEFGYAVQIFYKDVSEDELMKFGNGLELVKCDSGEGVHITDAKYSTPQHITAETKAPITSDGSEFSSVGDEVKGFDKKMWMSKDLSFTVENVEILDSINGLDRDRFSHSDHITMYLGEDGSILDKSVQQIIRGDGINTVDTVGDTFTYKQKLVYLTVKCVNKGDNLLENMFILPRITLTNQQDGKYSLGGDFNKAYCDKEYTPNSHNATNLFTVQPNEEFVYHVAYLLTEEELSRTILADFSNGLANLAKDESSFVRIVN